MTRQELWEQQYRGSRYMKQLDNKKLDQRFFDVFNNYCDVTPKGLFGITGFENLARPSLYWLEAITHLGEEYRLRGIGQPNPERELMSLFATEGYDYRRAARAIEGVSTKPPFLVRYGARQHITAMFEHGVIRVAPASSYNDPSLDLARRDNELYVHGSNQQNQMIPDFLVYCVTFALKPRLFGDFAETHAALVIRDPAQFFDRVDKAMSSALDFEWEGVLGAVKYIDPLRRPLEDAEPGFWKHFKYAYQSEWRYTWFPKSSRQVLQPVFLEMGSLRDISELVVLE
jgi:hypothetical protein